MSFDFSALEKALRRRAAATRALDEGKAAVNASRADYDVRRKEYSALQAEADDAAADLQAVIGDLLAGNIPEEDPGEIKR